MDVPSADYIPPAEAVRLEPLHTNQYPRPRRSSTALTAGSALGSRRASLESPPCGTSRRASIATSAGPSGPVSPQTATGGGGGLQEAAGGPRPGSAEVRAGRRTGTTRGVLEGSGLLLLGRGGGGGGAGGDTRDWELARLLDSAGAGSAAEPLCTSRPRTAATP
jgi:hypothetical protein